jgi:amidase
MNIYHLSATELVNKIKSKEISSKELTQLYIDRIEKYDNDINAVVIRMFDKAIEDAEKADEALSQGKDLGPLHGLPMTIKESYAIEGHKTTWGNEAFRNNTAAADGLAVQRFKDAGAHFIGKTNIPLDLADFQSYNAIYGTTNNPWDLKRIPGGSSGGSAAALAAGFTGLEAGSDIGGSIRNPAHYSGVYGHKPTYGIIPMTGHELVSNVPDADLAVCGPLARSAEDLRQALDIMAGPAEREAAGWKLNLPEADFKELKDLKIAVWANDEMAPVSHEIEERAMQVGETLAKLGATVSFEARPNFDPEAAQINYQLLLQSVMSGGMPPEEKEKIQKIVDQLDPGDFSSDAVNARGVVLSHSDWISSNFQREKLKIAWKEFFEEWDILICPQMATTAFEHDHRSYNERTIMVNNQEQSYFQQIFWAGMIVNAYLPSTVFPTGPSADGLPIGLQAVSGAYQDYKTIEFTRLLANEIGGFIAPPNYV